ncbi:hypothetical protein D3C80_1271150 [compost metagenome]
MQVDHLLLGFCECYTGFPQFGLHAHRVFGTLFKAANLQFQRPVRLTQRGKLIGAGGVLRLQPGDFLGCLGQFSLHCADAGFGVLAHRLGLHPRLLGNLGVDAAHEVCPACQQSVRNFYRSLFAFFAPGFPVGQHRLERGE